MIFEEMGISFSVPPSCILRDHDSYPGGQWMPGAHLNAASLCLSLNDKRGLDDVVILWRDEGDDSLPVHTMTLKELRTQVWYKFCCYYYFSLLYGVVINLRIMAHWHICIIIMFKFYLIAFFLLQVV